MKKEELKNLIKPIIKEALKEILIEEGFQKMISESKAPEKTVTSEQVLKKPIDAKKKIEELKQKMLQSSGFDPFSGTSVEQEQDTPQNDSIIVPGIQGKGVDISGLLTNKQVWNNLSDALKGKKV